MHKKPIFCALCVIVALSLIVIGLILGVTLIELDYQIAGLVIGFSLVCLIPLIMVGIIIGVTYVVH